MRKIKAVEDFRSAMNKGGLDMEEYLRYYDRAMEEIDKRDAFMFRFVALFIEWGNERFGDPIAKEKGEDPVSEPGIATRAMREFLQKEGNPYCFPSVEYVMEREKISPYGRTRMFRDKNDEFVVFATTSINQIDNE